MKVKTCSQATLEQIYKLATSSEVQRDCIEGSIVCNFQCFADQVQRLSVVCASTKEDLALTLYQKVTSGLLEKNSTETIRALVLAMSDLYFLYCINFIIL